MAETPDGPTRSRNWHLNSWFGGSLLLKVFCLQLAAQTTNLQWHDARDLPLDGKGWQDTGDYFDRLPARAQKIVRGPVWSLGHDSAGMCARFTTDATEISARWTLRKEQLAMAHMPASGVSGLDLYIREKGKWRWLGSGRPDKFPVNEKTLARNLASKSRDYLLYLPLYNGIEELKIGVPQSAQFAPGPPWANAVKPVVFYGTSILQGGCASRPGMAYPAILGRRLDVPHINLGFSGNAWSEPEVAHFIAELDPSVYVLDPLPNMTDKTVAERIEPFVKILREAHPRTPIILVENVPYPDGDFVQARHDRYSKSNARLREAYERLVKAGDKRLLYIPARKLLGNDGEATVDGTHATDLGFLRMAEAIEPTLRRALKPR
jgi:lysophospholipase L1-like esterase